MKFSKVGLSMRLQISVVYVCPASKQNDIAAVLRSIDSIIYAGARLRKFGPMGNERFSTRQIENL